ncbi:MAG: 2'-5' RNA ligase family protein [Terriglobia bacterium]
MPAGEKFSLWIVPAGDARDRLSLILDRLSAGYGAPEFRPHVTLLGSCVGPRSELIHRTAQVASALRPFVLRLNEMDFLDAYFRCLFVRAAPTEPLRRAHRAACQAFCRHREPPFMPHLSLLYGDFPPSLKEKMIAEIGPRLDIQFKVRSLHLYRTHGAPSQWRRVESFGLH